VGLLKLEVSSIPLRVLSISQCSFSSPNFFFAIKASPAIPALAPVKALKLRMSLVTGRRSERTPRAATGAVVVIEQTTRTAAAAARTQQQGEVAAVAVQVLATHDPHQERGRSSTAPQGCEVVEALLVVIPAPGGADRGGRLDQPPGPRSGCWWCGLTVA
jgi:hypothetical protein